MLSRSDLTFKAKAKLVNKLWVVVDTCKAINDLQWRKCVQWDTILHFHNLYMIYKLMRKPTTIGKHSSGCHLIGRVYQNIGMLCIAKHKWLKQVQRKQLTWAICTTQLKLLKDFQETVLIKSGHLIYTPFAASWQNLGKLIGKTNQSYNELRKYS